MTQHSDGPVIKTIPSWRRNFDARALAHRNWDVVFSGLLHSIRFVPCRCLHSDINFFQLSLRMSLLVGSDLRWREKPLWLITGRKVSTSSLFRIFVPVNRVWSLAEWKLHTTEMCDRDDTVVWCLLVFGWFSFRDLFAKDPVVWWFLAHLVVEVIMAWKQLY